MTGGVSADVEGWTGSTDEDSGVAAILSVSIALPGELGCSSACPTLISKGCSPRHISTSFYKASKHIKL